jgi:hypothetical protein
MKLSNETVTVLSNFSSINQGIKFKKGTKLSTVSSGKTVMATAGIKDEFPQDFCIYDLNQFLSVNSLFKDKPELNFTDTEVVFKNGKSKINYRFTAESMIVAAPEKELTLPTIDSSFTLSSEDYDWLMKTAKVLSSPNIGVVSDGDKIELITFDAKDDSAHTNSIEVGEGNGKKYKIVFKTENIKLIPGSYEVKICFKGFGHFKNTKDDIQYWVAFEAKESVLPN